jgi:hypothetical protein
MKQLLPTFAALGFAVAAASAHAATVTVLPTDVSASPVMNGWYTDNVRAGSSAAVTATNPHLGNGSAQMSLSGSVGKADFGYFWGFDPARTLGTLDALSLDWYRSASSTAAPFLAPAFRLSYDADGSAATTDDRGYLIWELVYNNGNAAAPTDQWVSTNILGANFWMRQFTPGNTVENYTTTLAGWSGGAHPAAAADVLGANTAVLGVEFGIGSGWNGSFSGFVDNVSFGFGGNTTTFNFEASAAAAVPEPGSLALLGLGLLGVALGRKRQSR